VSKCDATALFRPDGPNSPIKPSECTGGLSGDRSPVFSPLSAAAAAAVSAEVVRDVASAAASSASAANRAANAASAIPQSAVMSVFLAAIAFWAQAVACSCEGADLRIRPIA
jgi:hypothetical protein